jgi:protein-S-isoprenylcysteine O-methyltransferase Ste14
MESEKQIQNNETRSTQKRWDFSPLDKISMVLFGVLFIIQFIVLFLYEGQLDLFFLEITAYFVFGLGAILGIMPIIIFKKKGGVSKGDSYINTQKIVTTGLYAIIRHPQYLSFILLSTGITLLHQTWISLLLTGFIILLTYIWTFREDKRLIEKFGDKYSQYKENVPRLNIILGLIYYCYNKMKKKREE